MTNIIEMQILMILSTPCFAYFIARCKIFRVEKYGIIFQSALWR